MRHGAAAEVVGAAAGRVLAKPGRPCPTGRQMTTVRLRRSLLLVLAALVAAPARAQPPPGRGAGGAPGGPATAPGAAGLVAFTAAEQARIRTWFLAHPQPVQPLPPGIARNLARGKPLPPGIAKRYAPAGLLAQLVPRPGFEVLVVGASILLVHAASGIVHDILTDVVRGR